MQNGTIIATSKEKTKIMSTQKNLSLIIVGATVGAALALLLAPSSGKKTRKKLMKQAESIKDTVAYRLLQAEDQMGQLREKVGKKAAEVADDIV